DEVRGTIVLQSREGRVLAVARGVSGEFKHRDPRFLIGRAVRPATAEAPVPKTEERALPATGGARSAEQVKTEERALPATGGARSAEQVKTEERALPATGGARSAEQVKTEERALPATGGAR